METFEPFPKIARLSREVIITEKLDGTNAQIRLSPASDAQKAGHLVGPYLTVAGDFVLCAGSRNRWITPTDDNYGFARWVVENKYELMKLGPGSHFGEWWGQGIQRTYGLKEKRFSLFNVKRWKDSPDLPGCCHVVPLLAHEVLSDSLVSAVLRTMNSLGSIAAPGFNRPEGIVIYHTAAKTLFKKTLENDESPKTAATAVG